MTTGNKEERRKFPRIKDKGISIQIKAEGFKAITQSLDVSASGIYCKITERIPLMTRLDIVLELHLDSRETPQLINVEGIVVREHPVIKDGRAEHYDVAIYFNSLTPREHDLLVRYINGRSPNQ